jgi:hypothetical protein
MVAAGAARAGPVAFHVKTSDGLLMIEGFTSAWGVEEHEGGKRVWIRMPPHPGSP